MNILIDVSNTLKECREIKSVSLGQLASKSGLSKSYLSKIENGKRDPSITTLNNLCECLGIPISIFVLLAEEDTESELTMQLKNIAREAISSDALV